VEGFYGEEKKRRWESRKGEILGGLYLGEELSVGESYSVPEKWIRAILYVRKERETLKRDHPRKKGGGLWRGAGEGGFRR